MFDLKTVLLIGALVASSASPITASPADLNAGAEQDESQGLSWVSFSWVGNIASWIESVAFKFSPTWEEAGGLIEPFGDQDPPAGNEEEGPAAMIHENPRLESTQGGPTELWR